jgi:hypothetical protein
MRSYLVDVRTLFAFAVKRKYVRDNPALAVDLPKVDENPPGIVTPAQARAILNASIDFAPDALPVVVLSLFGGLRRAEAEQIEWTEISDEFVEVKAHKAKTRQRRLVPISPQLRAWLDTAKAVGGKLPALNYADKLKLILEKAKLRAEWPQNALRHSFASYHFAKHKNENETAALMGNSPQMVFQHYRELVRPAEAESFFAIMPPPDAVARASAARKRRPGVMSLRESKITADVVSAVFDAGRTVLPRKDAVAALRSQVNCSVAAAYNALSLEGRFATHLAEVGGKLTWKVEARPAAERELGDVRVILVAPMERTFFHFVSQLGRNAPSFRASDPNPRGASTVLMILKSSLIQEHSWVCRSAESRRTMPPLRSQPPNAGREKHIVLFFTCGSSPELPGF